MRTGKLKKLSLLRNLFRWVCFSMSTVHLIHANYRFVTLHLIAELEVPDYVYLFHLSYSFLVTLHWSVYLIVATRKVDIIIHVFNEMHSGATATPPAEGYWRKLKDYTFRDLYTIFILPYSTGGLWLFFPAIIFLEREMTQTMLNSDILAPYMDHKLVVLGAFLTDSYAGCYFGTSFFFFVSFYFLVCIKVILEIQHAQTGFR